MAVKDMQSHTPVDPNPSTRSQLAPHRNESVIEILLPMFLDHIIT